MTSFFTDSVSYGQCLTRSGILDSSEMSRSTSVKAELHKRLCLPTELHQDAQRLHVFADGLVCLCYEQMRLMLSLPGQLT